MARRRRVVMPRLGQGTWELGGQRIVANQVYYNIRRRGIERRLVPWCGERGIVIMAYSPLDQGRLPVRRGPLVEIARRHGASPWQVALAWTMRVPGMVVLVKSADEAHVRENAAARDLRLTERDLGELDRTFPMPDRDRPLEII